MARQTSDITSDRRKNTPEFGKTGNNLEEDNMHKHNFRAAASGKGEPYMICVDCSETIGADDIEHRINSHADLLEELEKLEHLVSNYVNPGLEEVQIARKAIEKAR
jgi:hypothetical protein